MASANGSDHGRLPSKGMRLGTKSCTECRRRKVRCIVEPSHRECKNCEAHGEQCISQVSGQTRQSGHQKKPYTPLDQDADTRQRLKDLEVAISRISQRVDPDGGSSSVTDFEMAANKALNHLRMFPEQETRTEDLASMMSEDLSTSSESQWSDVGPGSTNAFQDAPLVRLFEDAVVIQSRICQSDTDRRDSPSVNSVRQWMKTLNKLLPQMDGLTTILKATERIWSVQGAFPEEIFVMSIDKVSVAERFILDSLISSSPVVIARATLCLSICLQQLPNDYDHQKAHLPTSPKSLLPLYMKGAEELLFKNEGSIASIIGIECLLIQAKLYIDAGLPRKAWLKYREASSLALALGLHSTGGRDDSRYLLWMRIWQGEQQLSLNLGLPSSTFASSTRPNKSIGLSPGAQTLHELSRIAGQINERNLNHQDVDYSTTLEIDKNLQQCRDGVGSALLDATIYPEMPFEDLYKIQTAKLYYHSLCKFLHLPYLLQNSPDERYEYSKYVAIKASRDMIEAYQALRNGNEPSQFICDLMDFQIFTAAIVLVINLLSPSGNRLDAGDSGEDWERIHAMTENFKSVASTMTCSVAAQAAQLLEYLCSARDGYFASDEPYEGFIPYFGKVRISKVMEQASSACRNDDSLDPMAFSNTVNFDSNWYMPYDQTYMADCLMEGELGVDWTSFVNTDAQFDWSQSYDSSKFL
ncbi:hypothetical protein BJ875DRAFT_455957 [Amylocarpus encephaloides]|uniref:Zn(2)-C6 fungal-type domain-containing protein n=1 Tax=Amylocarpus encephaloides TaxID=45428 RepID=A0A9P7YN45_9HELO|nr:hypothetical protein BJ875DRAFT_455957 [Amylocarpus encephaloides]